MTYADNYNQHWNEKFSARPWGRYPPEDLVRFMGRNFKSAQKDLIKVLEVGCGPGANIWFLNREGFSVSGIDVSPVAIEIARERVYSENRDIGSREPDLRVGNFKLLPWSDNYFDVAIDIFALYANTREVISEALDEIARVLKPGALFYSKVFGSILRDAELV